MQTIGCDQHKHYCVMVSMNEKSEVVNEQKLYHNDPETLKQFLSQIPEGSRMAIEACGFDSWFCDLVESFGIKIHLAHPLKTKAIAEAKIKTDKLDARTLARLLHANLLAESYYAPAELREKRYLLRYRQCLVKIRSSLKNRIHSLIDRQGIQTPDVTDLFGNQGWKWLTELQLPPIYQNALNGYMMTLRFMKDRINETEKEIKKTLKEDPLAEILQTIPGIGFFSAFLLLAEIGPVDRFSSAAKLCSYAGLVPSIHQSGKVQYRGSITKQGNKFIRWILIEAAHRATFQDPVLNTFYQRIRYKKGSQKAKVAVARKLLTYVYHVLSKKEPYYYKLNHTKQARA